MTPKEIILLVAGILLVQSVILLIVFLWLKQKTVSLAQKMHEQSRTENMRLIIEPQSGLYRGADSRYGNVRGNGVIYLTDDSIIFKKLTGQRIVIDRAEIAGATVESSFRGKLSIATGGRHLVVRTKDGNRIGFLLRNAEQWVEKLGY